VQQLRPPACRRRGRLQAVRRLPRDEDFMEHEIKEVAVLSALPREE
jgi:hypothetical protein